MDHRLGIFRGPELYLGAPLPWFNKQVPPHPPSYTTATFHTVGHTTCILCTQCTTHVHNVSHMCNLTMYYTCATSTAGAWNTLTGETFWWQDAKMGGGLVMGSLKKGTNYVGVQIQGPVYLASCAWSHMLRCGAQCVSSTCFNMSLVTSLKAEVRAMCFFWSANDL